MPVRGELEDKYEIFKTRLRQNPDILHVTTCSKIPLFIDQGEFEWGETSDEKNSIARIAWVGYDFPETFDLELTAGFLSLTQITDPRPATQEQALASQH